MEYRKTSFFLCGFGLACSAVGLFILDNFLIFALGLIPTVVMWCSPDTSE